MESKKCNYLRQYHHYGGQLQFGQGHRDMDSWVLRCLPGVKITYHLSPTRCRGLQRIVSTKVKPTQSTWRGEQISFVAKKMIPCHRNGEEVEESFVGEAGKSSLEVPEESGSLFIHGGLDKRGIFNVTRSA